MSVIVKREKYSSCSDTINSAFESFNASKLIKTNPNQSYEFTDHLEVTGYKNYYPFITKFLKLDTAPVIESKKKISYLNPDQIKEFVPLTIKDSNKKASEKSQEFKNERRIDSLSVNFKYSLEFNWSFWFYKNNKNQDWEENLIFLTTIKFVEEFWSIFNYLKPVESLSDGCDYMFFKEGIRPCWEDRENLNGGRWLACINKSYGLTYLSDLWKNSLMHLIGSSYDNHILFINGVVVNVRNKTNKISLWIKEMNDFDMARDTIGKRFKRLLDTQLPLVYEKHQLLGKKTDEIKKNSD